jgi:hypothetical protein
MECMQIILSDTKCYYICFNIAISIIILIVNGSMSRSRKLRLTTVVIRCADIATPSIRKSWH